MTAVTSFIGGFRVPFSTTLYTGTGVTQNIVTGKNNAAGSLVWLKNRSSTSDNFLFDTLRGAGTVLYSNNNLGNASAASGLTAFNSNGFSLGIAINVSGQNYVAWSFLEAQGFFDIVTYTGTGSARTVAHNLGAGSTVGCVIVKCLSTAKDWAVYHRGVNGGVNPQNYRLQLNTPNTPALDSTTWNNTAPTDTVFTVGTDTRANESGQTYVAYVFAHNPSAGIFCGNFTSDGSNNATVITGWKPQFLLTKGVGLSSQNWQIYDKKRGANAILRPDTNDAETTSGAVYTFTSTGATGTGIAGPQSHIFIAIRDGV